MVLSQHFKTFYTAVEGLLNVFKKHNDYLAKARKRVAGNKDSTVPIRSFLGNWSIQAIESTQEVPTEFRALDQSIVTMNVYETVDLINFEPKDKEARRMWLKKMVLCPINIFTYRYGNHLGNLNIVWKIPLDSFQRDQATQVRIVNDLKASDMTLALEEFEMTSSVAMINMLTVRLLSEASLTS